MVLPREIQKPQQPAMKLHLLLSCFKYCQLLSRIFKCFFISFVFMFYFHEKKKTCVNTQDCDFCFTIFIPKFIFFTVLSSFFFQFNFTSNWRIITLQYCDGFHRTPTWICHMYPYIAFLLSSLLSPTHPTPPSRLSQCTGFGFCVIQQMLTVCISRSVMSDSLWPHGL